MRPAAVPTRPPPFPVTLLATETDVRRFVRRRLAAREHWLFPLVGRNAWRLVETIEDRFFPGRTPGFELLVLREATMGVPAVVFAQKKRLPAGRLNALLREVGAAPDAGDAGGNQDVIAALDPAACPCPPERGCMDPVGVGRTLAFATWLEGDGS